MQDQDIADSSGTSLLADVIGGLAASAPSSEWSGEELERVRPHVFRIAAAVLTDLQFETFTRVVAGETTSAIARDRQQARQSVENVLHGGARGGALKKLRAALSDDVDFLAVMRSIEQERVDDGKPPALLRWYAKILVPSKPEMFMPLAFLMVVCQLTDAKRTVPLAALYERVPRAAVDHALGALRLTGFVKYDGRFVTVLRTPLEAA
jgi:hypothetical protein